MYAWIDAHRDGYSISRLCRVIGVSRSGYCQWRTRPLSDRVQANCALDAEVAAIYKASRKSYGRPRIVAQLRSQGRCIGGERVTTNSDHRLPVASNLLERRFDGWSANQAWVSDITFLATGEGWLYLAAILDLASRRIVGWSMSERINADLVCSALRSACWQRKPPPGLILHSDQGSQYASRAYRKLAASWGMTVSMSRRANAWDTHL